VRLTSRPIRAGLSAAPAHRTDFGTDGWVCARIVRLYTRTGAGEVQAPILEAARQPLACFGYRPMTSHYLTIIGYLAAIAGYRNLAGGGQPLCRRPPAARQRFGHVMATMPRPAPASPSSGYT
jgi:hypothetical protein